MDNVIIRVGGRLAHGYSMTDDQRFPLLVSHRSKMVTLAINDAHKRTLHGGPTATVAEMRRQICVTQAMKKASACIKKCVTSFRFNSGPTQQLMGDLPSSRIEVPERAFSCVGLDFAGTLIFKNGTERVKGYVAVFICFASKAVHLEAVSSLTSDAMVAALRRFIARRGIPSQIVSVNATNFVGARRDLNELEKVVQSGAQLYSSIGRVMQLKLRHDGLARVALVRTSRGEFTRPVSKLRRLPIKHNDIHKATIECTQ